MKSYVIKDGDKIYVRRVQGFTPKNVIGVVPPNIAKADYPYITANPTVDEFGSPTWNITVDTDAKAKGQAAAQKEQALRQAEIKRTQVVIEKAQEVYPGVDAGELVLRAEVWRHMSANAQKYTSMGLKTAEQVNNADGTELFSPGSALDTVKKIKDYADRKLELYEDFLIAKAQAEQVYENEKEAAVGS